MFGNRCALAITMATLGLGLGVKQSHAQIAPVPMQSMRMAPTQVPLTAIPAPGTPASPFRTAPAEVTYEQRDGVQYQVTRRIVKRQVPVTVMRNQSRIVQVPVTTYRTIEEEVITRVAMSGWPNGARPNTVSLRPTTTRQPSSGPSATLTALPNYKPAPHSASPGMGSMGGVASRNIPSRQGKGWQTVEQGQSRYR
jgi:hypothetical protein